MPAKEELERLPLMWLAGVCKRISDADNASFPVAAREEAQKLWDEWFDIQLQKRSAARRRHGIDNNYKTREADLKTRTVAFLWRTDKLFPSLSCRSEERRVGKECRSRW